MSVPKNIDTTETQASPQDFQQQSSVPLVVMDEPTAWANVVGMAQNALTFWNNFIGLQSGANQLDVGAIARLTCIIRAVSWVESQHGTGAGASAAIDPMQCANPNDAWWMELTDCAQQQDRFVGAPGKPNYNACQLPAAASADGSFPAGASLSGLTNQANGHNDAQFSQIMSYCWGVPILVQKINNGNPAGNPTFQCLGLDQPRLVAGAVAYNGGGDPDYEAKINAALDMIGCIPLPVVTGISPTSGAAGGGTSVTVTGTGFTGATSVGFGITGASAMTVVSDTQITATSPAGTGTVDVTVVTPAGTSATSSADQFTYIAAPVVTGISPTSGAAGGGTSVTVTGTGFTGATSVGFGITGASAITVVSDAQITATSPAGTSTVDVTVVTPAGTSATSSADQFTYIAAPVVTGISPTSGAAGGGTSVTVTGTGFTGATSVGFGITGASAMTVVSDTQITATSPAGTGTVDVTVVTPGGTSATSSADQLTYIAAPVVTGISPTSGAAGGGTSVTMTGAGFTGATSVGFGITGASAITVVSDAQITATSPAGTGTVDVTVVTPAGTSATSSADQFTYIAAPVVTGISPTSGAAGGGTSVTVTGTGFTGATSVGFGITGASAMTVVSDTQITATSPAGTGTVDVTVVTPGGTSATSSADQFSYTDDAASPAVTGINGQLKKGNLPNA